MKRSELIYHDLEQARKECADYKRDKNWFPSVDSMLQRICIDLYEEWKTLKEREDNDENNGQCDASEPL